jgi:hypothetical protein
MPSFAASPYRAPAPPTSDVESPVHDPPDRDLWPVLAALWVASAARIAGAVWLHQVFGTEATLAAATFVLAPCLIGHGLAAARTRP